MKTLLVVFAVMLGVAAAQQSLADLVHLEVQALLALDPQLTEHQCTTECDAMFDLSVPADEAHTDDLCLHACQCEIQKNCGDHTHPPHPTHPGR